MAEQSAKNLLKLLEKSKLCDREAIKAALVGLPEKAAGKSIGKDLLIEHLIENGIITQWHADKLKNGKYKGFFLDKYKLLGHLGTGGMSSVYLAESKSTSQKRAIKVLPKKKVSDKSYLDRFYREGKAAAALNHPHVVRIYDINNSGDTHYMVMEYVKGADLYDRVKDDGPMAVEDAADAIFQAAKGLKHAHEHQMVHRDIKPANLLMTDEGVLKILDLGLALFSEEGEESLTVMYNERVMGTADYLSPEQAVNSHEVDHRADIYSLGCTLYFLLTGRPPFSKGTLAQRIAMHQTQEPDPIHSIRPEVPQIIVDICSRMMRKKPEERFANCDEIMSVLKSFLKTGSSVSGSSLELGEADSAIMASGSGVSAATSDVLAEDTLASSDKGSIKQQLESLSRVDLAALPSLSGTSSQHFEDFAVVANTSPDGEPRPAVVKPTVAPRIRKREKKKAPVWLVPLLIFGLIFVLMSVLGLVSFLAAPAAEVTP